jgi:excisionase family DNA binding protein
LHHLFDMPNVFGLADVLTKPEAELDAALERVIRPTDIDNLFLLPAGKLPADPTYLLGLPVLDRVLERLQQKADFIIVDSGPLLTHPDPVLLATHLDGVILVAWDRRTTRSNIKKAIERMDVIEPTKLLGVVFNGVSLPQDRFYAYSRAAFRPAGGNEAVTKKQGVLGWLSRGTRDSSIETADGEALLSLSDVSEYLGVAESTAKRWCEEGRIPATRVGRQWQIKLADLTEFAQT